MHALERDGDMLYMAGDFSKAGYQTGPGAKWLLGADQPDISFPELVDRIEVSIPDGEGGWYVGGSFRKIEDEPIGCLVHLWEDHSIDWEFQPEFDGVVKALVLDGEDLYIGGTFTMVNGYPMANLAKMSAD